MNIKKGLLSLLFIPLLVSCSNPSSTSINKADKLTIYSFNDSHGDLLRDKQVGANGFDAISAIIKKDNQGEDYFSICTGDMFQGQYISNETKGRAVIDALNYLDCKAFALGNHEFDWSIEEIHKYKDGDESNGEFNGEFIAANIIQKSINKRPDWIKPYTIVEKGHHKVGIIGFIGEEIESGIHKDMIADYEFVETLPLYNQYSKELKEEHHCDLIIVGIHDYQDRYTSFVDQEVPVQTIFGGHTHKQELNYYKNDKLPYDIPFIEGGYSNDLISKVSYTYNDKNEVYKVDATHLKNDIPDDEIDLTLTHLIEDKYYDLFAKYNELLCNDFPTMDRDAWMVFIGDVLADGVDAGCINKGGIRSGTDYTTSTKLYYKQLYRIMPFDNQIFQVKVDKALYDEYQKDNAKTMCRYSKNVNKDKSYYVVNVVDYVFTHKRDQFIWGTAEIIKTHDVIARDYVANYLKGLF